MGSIIISDKDWIAYKENAVNILRKQSQYATAKAVEIAIGKRIHKIPHINEFDEALCPSCGEMLLEGEYICLRCGQALKR